MTCDPAIGSIGFDRKAPDRVGSGKVHRVLGRKIVEGEQCVELVDYLGVRLGKPEKASAKAWAASSALSASARHRWPGERFSLVGEGRFGKASIQFAVLCAQHRCSWWKERRP